METVGQAGAVDGDWARTDAMPIRDRNNMKERIFTGIVVVVIVAG